MDEREVFEGIKTATVLKPGDRVLLTMDGYPTPEQMAESRDLLGQRFPEVEFTLASGVESVTVVRDQKLIEEETERG